MVNKTANNCQLMKPLSFEKELLSLKAIRYLQNKSLKKL